MKTQGFTLIEVLVVVLIISILTSIALPQYQKAVAKAQYARAKLNAAPLANAMEAYYATYQQYTPNMDNLDISISFTPIKGTCTEESDSCSYKFPNGDYCTLRKNGRVYCYTKDDTLWYAVFLAYADSYAGRTFCFAQKSGISPDDWNYKFCQQETGSSSPSSNWASATSYKAFEYVR